MDALSPALGRGFSRERFDLLLDCRMPIMDGHEVAQAIRAGRYAVLDRGQAGGKSTGPARPVTLRWVIIAGPTPSPLPP
jgi:CheY-like chemotaxis protein